MQTQHDIEAGGEENTIRWAMLPADLVQNIAERLPVDMIDYIRFRSVCKPWRSATADPRHMSPPPPPQLPWIMLSYDEFATNARTFYRLIDGKPLTLDLPEAGGSRIVGSADGWLLLVDHASVIRLLDPLTRAQILLPALTTLPMILGFREQEVGEEYIVGEEVHPELGFQEEELPDAEELVFQEGELADLEQVFQDEEPAHWEQVYQDEDTDEEHEFQDEELADEEQVIQVEELVFQDEVTDEEEEVFQVEELADVPVFQETREYTLDADTVKDFFLHKAIVIHHSKDCTQRSDEGIRMVVANASWINRLLFARPGDGGWAVSERRFACTDVLYHRGQVYAVDDQGVVALCDTDPPGKLTPITPGTGDGDLWWYLVESSGDLLVVARIPDHDHCDSTLFATAGFDVYRLDRSAGEEAKLVEVKSLGDRMLFLGSSRSLSLSARDFPRLKGNCIYFTADLIVNFDVGIEEGGHAGHDFGVFDLDDGSIRSLPCCPDNSRFVWPPPVLFTPR